MSAFEISGNGKELATALGRIAPTLQSRSTLPILSCAALEITNGEMTATVSDLEARHTITLPVAIKTGNDGAGCCAAMSLLSGVLARFGEDEVTITLKGDSLKLVSGSKTATIQTLAIGDFPNHEGTFSEPVETDGKKLAAAIRSVAFAQSKDPTRYIINSVFFDNGNIVASNGSMLAHAKSDTPFNAVIASTFIPAITAILERGENIRISSSESEILIQTDKEIYSTKKMEGHYPQWDRVLPKYRNPARYTFNREDMRNVLAFANLYTEKTTQAIRIEYVKGELKIGSRAIDKGEFSGNVALIEAPEKPLIGTLKSEYLAQTIAVGDSDTIYFETEPDEATGHIESAVMFYQPNMEWRCCIMPMRVVQ